MKYVNLTNPTMESMMAPSAVRIAATSYQKPLISVIIPAYNESANMCPVLEELDAVLANLNRYAFQIIVIDDGSKDETASNTISTELRTPLTLFKLSRNFGKEIAMSAGLTEASASDAVILMDADGQHPPAIIPALIQYWEQGYDDVFAVRDSRTTDNWFKRSLSHWFYRLLPNDVRFITADAGDFRLLSARVVQALNQLPEKNRFMKGLYGWVGFRKKAVPYQVRPRLHGETRFRFTQLVRFALLGITSFSTLPLRIISRIGLLVSAFALLYGAFIFTRTLLFGTDLPGWATLTVGLTMLSGVQLIAIGILGEYLGQIFIESKNRPLYFVEEILHRNPNNEP